MAAAGYPSFSGARGLLDAAPGPLHPRARETLLAALDAGWADPRRLHAEARRAAASLDQARAVIAADLGVRPSELSFHVGGAPVAIAAALDGLRWPLRRRGARLVASAVEHSAVIETGAYAAAQAADPDLLELVPVDHDARVDLAEWDRSVRVSGTVTAALQHANGEVGTIQPVDAAYESCLRAEVPLLVDGQASVGRVAAPAAYDVLVADAATAGGPPLGLLVVPERVRFARSGRREDVEFKRADASVWVPLALAAAEAWQQTRAVATVDEAQSRELTARLRSAVAALPDVALAGSDQDRLPHVVTFSALYADGEAVVTELDRRGLAVASGSACTSSTVQPSHVLSAMGLLTHGNVRITLPLAAVAPDRAASVDRLIHDLPEVLAGVRQALGASGL